MQHPPLAKRLKRFLRYVLIRAALALVSPLPLGVGRWLGTRLGALAFLVAGGERRKALRSLARAFPEKSDAERQALARACFRHLAAAAFEVGCTASLDRRLEDFVAWPEEDRRVLEAALSRGRGVVFVSGHVGNWELLARRVARAGYPSQSIAKETTDPRVTALVERFRARGGVRSIWRGQEGAARAMLRTLKAGEILGLLIDQDTRVQSLFVPFFGELAATPRAAADLALRTGAAVVVGFCQREGRGYRMRFEEVPTPETDDREAAALALTAALSERIEAAIRRAPEQWVWMHQRWKTRPEREAPVAAG
ncbi:lysophospholipid acyltransferase family protein [Myxococcaceae bacterium GXIMD 01537]